MSGSTGYIALASDVSVNPGVVPTGGSQYALNGLMLTASTRVPVGTIIGLPNLAAVQAVFGPTSPEAGLAAPYFAAPVGSTVRPATLFFAQCPYTGPVAAYLRGGNISNLTLAQLQAIAGPLSVVIDGATKSGTINLTAATSFSNAATLITSQLGLTGGQAATYDSVSGAFVITSGTNGVGSSLALATGTAAAPLLLTGTTGGTLSQGAATAAGALVAFMTALRPLSAAWFGFMTVFEPTLSDKVSLANWNNQQSGTTAYAEWDSTLDQTVLGTIDWAYNAVAAAGYVGVVPTYLDPLVAAGTLGYFASIDWNATQGTKTLKFRNFAGVVPTVTNSTIAANLKANGINYYGISGDSLNNFTYMREGTISGPFAFCDAYMNNAYFSRQMSLTLINLLLIVNAIPYNADGMNMIQTALQSVITQMLNFGAIAAGVVLGADQIVQVNTTAGAVITDTIFAQGWYLQIKLPTAAQRKARTSPVCNFWYTFGGAVHNINLSALLVQ